MALQTTKLVGDIEFGPYSMLASVSDDTPLALAIAEQTIVGRITGGNIAALTVAELQTLAFSANLPENVTIRLDPILSADTKWTGTTRDVVAGTTALVYGYCYYCASTGKWELTNATAIATSHGEVGMCVIAAATDATGTLLMNGMIRADDEFDTFTKGSDIYLSASTAGKLTATAPTGTTDFVVRIVASAPTADSVSFKGGHAYAELGDTVFVTKATYGAQSILAAVLNDTPVVVTVAEQTLVGRKTGGDVTALTAAETSAIVHSVGLAADWDVLDNKITAQNLTADALTAGRGVFTGTDGLLSVDGAFIWDNTNKRLGIGVTPLHIIHVSSSIDTGIGIGTTDAGREAYLALYSNSVSIGTFEAFGSTFAVADYQSAVSFTAQVNNDGKIFFTTKTSGTPTARMVILNNGNVGIGTTAPGAKCHVDQSSTSGAIPVLTLDQADVDEDFMKFIGTSDTNVDRALVDAADFTTPGSIVGWLKIAVQDDQATNPITDGDYYVPFYAAPSA